MSRGDGFDPSREWLGIDAVDLADPFRVLRVSRQETDPAVVASAVERLMARLRAVDPGPFRIAHDALTRRIEASRREVLADIEARRPRFVPPPVPRRPGFAYPVADPFLPPRSDPESVPEREPAAAWPVEAEAEVQDEQEDADEPAGSLPTIRTRRPRRRPAARPSIMPAAISVVALAATAALVFAFWPRLAAIVGLGPGRGPRAAASRRAAEESPRMGRIPVPRDGERGSGAIPPEPTATTTESGAPPTAGLETERPMDELSDEDRTRVIAAVEPLLRGVFEDLVADDFDVADARIATAADLAARDAATADRVAGWRQFVALARQTAGFREQALDAVGSGGDIDVGSGTIAVVESTPAKFIMRRQGQNITIEPRADVPGAIVTAILKRWFDGSRQAGNNVFLGVHLLLRRPPDRAAAAATWAKAKDARQDVSALEPLLQDPVILTATGE